MYENKAKYLQALIHDATGLELSDLPSSIKEPLDVIAHASHSLGIEDVSLIALESRMTHLSAEQTRIQQHMLQLERTEEQLQDSMNEAKYRDSLVASWLSCVDELDNDRVNSERQKKAMIMKAREYQQQLATLTSSQKMRPEDPSITSLLSLQDQIQQKERDLIALKSRLAVFKGLPPNLDLARQELRASRERQIQLMNIREKLLGKMTDEIN
ncbi:hypothetical protein M422DRAFT_227887 [Sphaerobolus stellatus SS14]|uniref:Uncharacterized protein n=1 Tax=Sphaerobolus stellatus (strain SS14) TaxID=990650 RepID=A0A0C9VRY4_SPHS4|nr:hypothetical protein M422DRAFT_227887 [Sphaerobolus stellatus SS14]